MVLRQLLYRPLVLYRPFRGSHSLWFSPDGTHIVTSEGPDLVLKNEWGGEEKLELNGVHYVS